MKCWDLFWLPKFLSVDQSDLLDLHALNPPLRRSLLINVGIRYGVRRKYEDNALQLDELGDESEMRVSAQEYFIGLTAIDTAKVTESSTLIGIQFCSTQTRHL